MPQGATVALSRKHAGLHAAAALKSQRAVLRRYFRYRFSGNYLTRIRVTVAGASSLLCCHDPCHCQVALCLHCMWMAGFRTHLEAEVAVPQMTSTK